MLVGKRRFSEFLGSPEKITTNVLTDRLIQMERVGVIKKQPYQLHHKRFEYTLTRKGKALLPLLQETCRWGNRFIPGTWKAPASFMARKTR